MGVPRVCDPNEEVGTEPLDTETQVSSVGVRGRWRKVITLINFRSLKGLLFACSTLRS